MKSIQNKIKIFQKSFINIQAKRKFESVMSITSFKKNIGIENQLYEY